MYIKIFQINGDRDVNRVKFCGLEETEQYQGISQIDPAIYDEVFSGEVDCKDLEQVYEKFNLVPSPLHRGHSVSVSDVILTDDGAYFCDSVGFEPVEFDSALTHKPENLLRCVMVEPGKPAYKAEIADELRAMKRAVGGRLETSALGENHVVVSNEMAKIRDMLPNREVYGDIICGNFFIVGDNHDGEFRSLTDEETQDLLTHFAEPEFTDPDEELNSGLQMT
jgi:hypothetical protein